jgi:hypothetical protein
MAPIVGTLDINSLLAVKFQSAAEFGLNKIQAVFEADLAAHNQIVNELVSDLCELTTDRQRIYGSSVNSEMVEVDEFGRSPTQKVTYGDSCGFPLRLFQYAIGWTDKWFQTHTPAEMAHQLLAAEKAHLKAIQNEIKKALFLSANYDFVDFLVDKVTLHCKRLVNADGMAIPEGPNGEAFDPATHTHYNANAALTAEKMIENAEDVLEHGHSAKVLIAINRAQEATVRGLAEFKAYTDPRLIYRVTDTPGQTLDITRLDNRAIGLIGPAEVWVKPWVPANYQVAWDASSPNKPLAFRQRASTQLQGLRVAANLAAFPLNAQYLEAEFGISVWTRTNGAVLYSAGAVYADPAL